MNIETLAIHADHSVDALTGAVMPPIHLSTTFERAADGSYPGGFEYIREHNPTRKALEDMLCALEDGSAAAAFSSGMAATMSILQALPADGHVVAPLDAYFGTTHLLHDLSSHQKLSVTFVEMTDVEQIQQAVRPTTQLIWVETPSNPLLAVTDLAQVAALAHERRVLLACDNTWATPVFQHPFQLGADVVMHSMTKYLGGHSDVLGGAVIVKDNEAFFIEHRASIEGPTTRTPDNLLRLSIGLEHPHDLIEDLTQALEGAKVW